MEERKVFTGKRVKASSFDGGLRKRLDLPAKQLVYYADVEDEWSRENVVDWEIEKALVSDGYTLVIRTKKREVHLYSGFFSMMQHKNFIKEWERLSAASPSPVSTGD